MRGRGEGESGEKYGELDVGDSGLVSSPFSHGARAKSTLRAHGRARTRARPYCSARIEMLITCSSKIVYSVPIYIHNVNKSRVAQQLPRSCKIEHCHSPCYIAHRNPTYRILQRRRRYHILLPQDLGNVTASCVERVLAQLEVRRPSRRVLRLALVWIRPHGEADKAARWGSSVA